jgi:hypothetical protein
MHYMINVANAAGHLFATAPHSCQSPREMRRVWGEITKRFPESEGFKVTVTRWENTGRQIDDPHME